MVRVGGGWNPDGARAGVWKNRRFRKTPMRRSKNRVGGPMSRGGGESRVLHRHREGPGRRNGGRSG